jgi:PAS domain S-box-containing protein
MTIETSTKPDQQLEGRLPRNLTSLETSGFGLTGHLIWISTAPAMHIALGPQAIFVWLPATIIGMMLNFQVKYLGTQWSDVSGGTPNYTTRLLHRYPRLGQFSAIAYYFSWAVIPSLNAVILSDLIKANLEPLGLPCPETALKIGFTLVPYVVALGGTRALSILHSFFVLPAIGFLLMFCLQGFGWLTFSPASPGLVPANWSSFSFMEWAKWFFFAVYGTYACETASSFVGDSCKPTHTLRFLSLAAWLIPVVYLGGTWVLTQLDTASTSNSNTFFHLLTAAKPFWGSSASLFITLLLTSGCLLSSATAVSNAPRVLYQMALDRQLAPVFAVVSHQGVLGPSLSLTLVLSLLCLSWGNVAGIVVVGSTAYMVPMMAVHLGMWLRRGQPEALWSGWSLGFFLIEGTVLLVGGLAWSWVDVAIGLLGPLVILIMDALIRTLQFAPFQPEWWLRRRSTQFLEGKFKDFVAVQVIILIILVCGSTTIGWMLSKLGRGPVGLSNDLLITVLMITAFVAIAIACWTSLPQVAAIAEAREHAEGLFIAALDTVPDTILVLDERGSIQQSNPAAVALFEISTQALIGQTLSHFFPKLGSSPELWLGRSEQTFKVPNQGIRTIEFTISHRNRQKVREYIVILRDITERKQAEADLRDALWQKESLALKATAQAKELEVTLKDLQKTQAQLIQTEKMSSLGQLVAGVAHEINNPVNFIYGNLRHVSDYTQDLLELLELYQQSYSNPNCKIQARRDAIDIDFLIEDLPKMLNSMKVGADRIRQIVLTLRNFSRLDEAAMKPVNLHDGIDSTLMILQSRLKAKTNHPGIQIVKQYGDLPEVECYASQLNQVFMNLINNAIDALYQRDDERSEEEIANAPSTITLTTQTIDPDWAGICIKDNGPGMTEAVRTKLFDPFFTTKPVGQGTGLGLSISYQIVVDKHGGKLKCISAPNQGSEFWVIIPVRQVVSRAA